MPRPRVAVVGTSHWHHKFYRETIAKEAEVVAFSDPSPAKIKEVEPFYGSVGVGDWRQLLAAELRLDAVVVLAPHDEMMDVSRAFIARHVPVILEKPGGLNAPQVRAIEDAAKAQGVPIAVGFIQRAGPLWRLLQTIGPLDYVTFTHQSGPPERYIPQSPWALEKVHAGGGSFINVGVHYVDLFLQATRAREVVVQAQAQRRLSATYDVEDQMTALVSTPDGVSAVIEIGYIYPKTPFGQHLEYHARGRDAFLAIDVTGKIVVTSTATGEHTSSQEDITSGPLTRPWISSCLAGVANGFEGLPGIADLRRTMQVVDAAYASAGSGTAVRAAIDW